MMPNVVATYHRTSVGENSIGIKSKISWNLYIRDIHRRLYDSAVDYCCIWLEHQLKHRFREGAPTNIGMTMVCSMMQWSIVVYKGTFF